MTTHGNTTHGNTTYGKRRSAFGVRPSAIGLIALVLTACASAPTQPDGPGEPPPQPEQRPALRTPAVTATARPSTPTLVSGATVLVGDGTRIERGHVLLVDGRIAHVGPERPAELPEGTVELDATGRFVTPGLIDTHSHLGVYPTPHVKAHGDGNEATSPVTAEVDAEHSVWPQDPGLQRALAGGITTLQILPGSANLVGGRSAVLKLHPAREAADMRFPDAPIGLKMACGENPKRVYGDKGGPSTRMGSIARMRATFQDARGYADEWDKYEEKFAKWRDKGASEDDKPQPPKTDLGKATLAAMLDGDILVHVHCYRADEMLTQIALAEEFGYKIKNFHHAVEAYKIRDVLARHDIGVSTWADWWGFKIEAWDAIPEAAGLIARDGGRVIIHSDSAVGIQRLNQEAAKALYRARHSGVEAIDEDDALTWITLNPAWSLGIDEHTGTLHQGKMADLVVWSAQPLSTYAQAELVFVDGVLEFDRASDPQPWSDFEAGTSPWLDLTPAPTPASQASQTSQTSQTSQ